MTKWEYRSVPLLKDEEDEARLKRLGLEGWEMVSVLQHVSNPKLFVCFLKREFVGEQ